MLSKKQQTWSSEIKGDRCKLSIGLAATAERGAELMVQVSNLASELEKGTGSIVIMNCLSAGWLAQNKSFSLYLDTCDNTFWNLSRIEHFAAGIIR